MIFEITVPDQVVEDEPEMKVFLQAFQLLVNRMAVSHFKYGAMSNKYPDSASAIASGQKRIDRYAISGNTEECLDAANFCIIEYVFPSHKNAHFRAQDTHESPGIEWKQD